MGFLHHSTQAITLTLCLAFGPIAHSQAQITPAADGTGTQVNQTGGQFAISGGTQAGNNLFHSFETFGLDTHQVANFLSHPDIANILGRVSGGDASVINGLLQVSGSNANLFLLNPAGILFGPDAQLNVPGSFTATTATGIGFDQGVFGASGSNNYSNLVGAPNRFIFAGQGQGSIVNTGNLAVSPDNSLSLIGSTVINTGILEATEGQVLLLAVPENNVVRLSQDGMVLNLELQGIDSSLEDFSHTIPAFTPWTLAQLLTGGSFTNATGLTVNPNGTVALTGSGLTFVPEVGTTIVAGNVDVSGNGGGDVGIFGDRIALVNANINASGVNGGGTVLVGGEYQGQGPVPNATAVFFAENSLINADAINQGDGGRVIVWGDDVTKFLGTITARGGLTSGNGGFVETSGKNHLEALGTVDTSATHGQGGAWLLDPRNIEISASLNSNISPAFTATGDNAVVNSTSLVTALSAGTTVTVSTGTTGSQAGNITVIDPIAVTAIAGSGIATLILNAANDISVNADISTDDTDAGHVFNVTLNAGGDIDTSGATIDTAHQLAGVGTSQGGTVTLSAGGNITIGAIDTTSTPVGGTAATGGNVTLTAGGNIIAGTIDSSADPDGGSVTTAMGGIVELTAGGNITTGAITTLATDAITATGGNVKIVASGSITTGALNTSATASSAGIASAESGDVDLNTTVSGSNISFESIDTVAAASGGSTKMQQVVPSISWPQALCKEQAC